MNSKITTKLLSLILCLVLLIPQGFLTNTISIKAASKTGIVNATSLNIRMEPSTSAPKLNVKGADAYLVKGDKVEIIKEVGGWYQINLVFNNEKVKGYVKAEFITVENAKGDKKPEPTVKPTATPKPTPKPSSTNDKIDYSKVDRELKLAAKVVANSLNIRQGPGTNYKSLGSLKKGSSITIVNEFIIAKEKWYRIQYKEGSKNKYGYVLSNYIELNFSKKVQANISVKSIKIKKNAGLKQAYLKNKKGNIVSLKKNKAIQVIKEVTISNQKWFQISFKVSNVNYKGYVLANDIAFKITEKKPAPTPTPTVTPTVSPSPTQKPNDLFVVKDHIIYRDLSQKSTGFVANIESTNVIQYYYDESTILRDYNNNPIMLKNKDRVDAFVAITLNDITWYYVEFTYENISYSGYIKAEYIYIGDDIPGGSSGSNPGGNSNISDAEFRKKLELEGFPQTYITSLMELHAMKPMWEFKAYHTNLAWDTVIKEQSIPGKNLLPNNKSIEWKSLESGAYNWKNDSFAVFDGSTWVTASKEAIEYYMDPRNFLTLDGIFQFELLKYHQEYQNIKGVENVLKGTALHNTYYTYNHNSSEEQTFSYAETFIKAAEYSGVSPYHLASRVKQEVVTGPTTLSNSVSGKVKGFEGLYNFFNIGANDSNKPGENIANGLRYAKNGTTNATNNALYMIPWTNPYKSLVGGAYIIGNNYINRGQDTVYLQKFNVTPRSTYFHQYMTNVEAPFAEGKKIAMAYSSMEDVPIVFSIPVYSNMPNQKVPYPVKKYNPNNRMKSLKVADNFGNTLALTPSFNQEIYEYSIIADSDVDFVKITANAVSNKAKVNGAGSFNIVSGNNSIIVTVVAENGDEAQYVIKIIK